MNFRTIQDRVVVEVEFNDDLSASGIYLGEGEAKNEATVIAVGPGKKFEVAVKVGDRVIINPEVGSKIKIAGKKLLVLREDDLLGVLE